LHLEFKDDSVASFGVSIDASARNTENHTPILVTYTKDCQVHAKLWANSVDAGESGDDQSKFLIDQFSDVLHTWKAVEYDTTGSNTGEKKGLRSRAQAQLEWPLTELLCFLHAIALPQVDFANIICGKIPKLQSGA